jgi:hypothetical protein
MAVFTETKQIVFANARQKGVQDWLTSTGLDPEALPDLKITVSVTGGLSDFSDDEISDRYDELFPLGSHDARSVDRAYRYLAAGDVAAAMEELSSTFGLAPPSHERAIADLLSGTRNPTHV